MKIAKDTYQLFVINFVAFAFMIPLLVMGFNYSVDPNHRYRFSVSARALHQLAHSGEFVLTLPRNFDDRALLKKFVPQAVPPKILVLGGSRIMNIQPEMFRAPKEKPLLNAGAMAGTIRDYLALWQLVKQTGFRPEIVYICLEEQSLNSISQNDRYLSIFEYYNAFYSRELSLRKDVLGVMTNLKDLLSFQTTQASVKILASGREQNPELVPLARYDGTVGAKTYSFSMLNPASDEIRTPTQTDPMARGNGVGEVKVFEKWNPLDRRGYNHLIALLRDIKKEGARPLLIGMPYHPEAYKMLRANPRVYQNLLVFVEALRKISQSEGVFFYDAIEDHHAEFESDDFLDGVHLKMTDNYRLFRNVDQAAGLGATSPDFRVDASGRVVRQKV